MKCVLVPRAASDLLLLLTVRYSTTNTEGLCNCNPYHVGRQAAARVWEEDLRRRRRVRRQYADKIDKEAPEDQRTP